MGRFSVDIPDCPELCCPTIVRIRLYEWLAEIIESGGYEDNKENGEEFLYQVCREGIPPPPEAVGASGMVHCRVVVLPRLSCNVIETVTLLSIVWYVCVQIAPKVGGIAQFRRGSQMPVR